MEKTDRISIFKKKKIILYSMMRFIVHHSFLITVAVMCMVHATLLGVMAYARVWPLVNFNILSVVVYLFCIVFCRFGHIMPVYISILLEVTVYSVMSVYYIGWACGSVCFLCSIVPIIIYFGCFLLKGSRRWIIVLSLALNFFIYVFLYILFADAEPLIRVESFVRHFLIIFSSFVMVFSMIFYNVIYIYSSETLMSSLERKNEKLTVDAKVDVLTSLLNRRGFLPIVESLMDPGSDSHFCIAFCDIDNFKRINDSYGHDCGDEVLRHISGMIKKEMAGCDICRWGGEELVILMKDYDLSVARNKMEYLRKHIETNPTVFYNKRISATVTIGLEEYSEDYSAPDDIIRIADERMYYGKQHGKNILIYEDIPQA